jgi:hypothetical protein
MSTKEEAFFGVKNEVATGIPDDDFEIEFVDDTPEEDQRYTTPPKEILDQQSKENLAEESDDESEENNSEEIKNVSGRVEKRIKKLRREYHEERRAKELAERLSNEAMRATEKLMHENKRLSELVFQSQEAAASQSLLKADAEIKLAEDQYKAALDAANNTEIVNAQKRLTDAQMFKMKSEDLSKEIQDKWTPEPEQTKEPEVNFNQVAPDPKALEWQERNEWFGTDSEMTSFAYGVHDKIVSEGVDPETNEYYQLIDSRMRQVFPDQFSSETTVVEDELPRTQASNVVAPAKRGAKGSPRKVTLTSTQLRLAKRLGLTPQQYAAQLLKEAS